MIDEYFKDFFDSDLSNSFKNNSVILEEKSNTEDNQLKRFKLDFHGGDVKIIKSDKIKIEKLFKGAGKGQRKHCDYLIITNDKVYFIELQSSIDLERKDGIDYVTTQFKGTLCITYYIDSVLINFYNKNKFFDSVQKRYILFCKNLPISKSKLSLKDLTNESNDKPENFKIIQVDNDGVIAVEELG